MAQELKLGRLYRHYKTNGIYMALQLVKNTGDGQNDAMHVLYWSFGANLMFVRPLTEFVAEVEMPNDRTTLYRSNTFEPRFKLLESIP